MVEFGDIIMELASYLSPVDYMYRYEVEIVRYVYGTGDGASFSSLKLYSIDSVDSTRLDSVESSGEPEPRGEAANRQRNRQP